MSLDQQFQAKIKLPNTVERGFSYRIGCEIHSIQYQTNVISTRDTRVWLSPNLQIAQFQY